MKPRTDSAFQVRVTSIRLATRTNNPRVPAMPYAERHTHRDEFLYNYVFLYGISKGKRACEPPKSGRSTPPIDNCNPRGVTGSLSGKLSVDGPRTGSGVFGERDGARGQRRTCERDGETCCKTRGRIPPPRPQPSDPHMAARGPPNGYTMKARGN
ncbi:hypothetical protein EVAR_77259_1 [Eumeta japonica]|uniref:Uncharacterized protein n=1 Tax=Eumeta variegata TaxID=151549 RepID=A0A4C1ULE4_EUMVA|nr:hypothetical protein EVAR_77259_1 [Eumeta japonica]